MRIITGRYKGRAIKAPKDIRPSEDRVRKAFFDIIGDISGLSFLELFAGSGAMGLEALSQGAARVVFVEKDTQAVKAIKENISALFEPDAALSAMQRPQVCLIHKDCLEAVMFFAKNKEKFDLIFLDPPYYVDLAEKTLQRLEDYDILTASGFVIIQHFKKDRLPQKQGQLVLFKQSQYGDTLLSFYKKEV
jgi:16S rRNA (guanine(966)-N(2))-methyltransferase RsmD